MSSPSVTTITVCLTTQNGSGRNLKTLCRAWTFRCLAPNAAFVTTVKRIGLAIVFLWFMIGGLAHFVVTEVVVRIVPPYIPYPRAAVLVSGAFELIGAAGLIFAGTRRAAGIGLFILTLAVTPANVYMLQRADLFDIPLWMLIARLPLQALLLILILWSTSPPFKETNVTASRD